MPRTSQDKSLQDRRHRIVTAAMACFLERGYHQTGMRDVAAKAGVSLGNLYNHFAGKEDLLVAIARLEAAELEPFIALLREPASALETLKSFIKAYRRYAAQPVNALLTMELTNEAVRNPKIGDIFLANRKNLISALVAMLKRGMKNQEFSRLGNIEESAKLILDLLESQALRSQMAAKPSRGATRELETFISRALGATE